MLRTSVAILASLVFASAASAQFTQQQFGQPQTNIGGGSQTYGSFGSRTLGGGISGRSTAGRSTSQTMPTLQSAQEGAGGVQQGSRFLRENRQGAFVGADTADAANLRSNAANSQMSGLNSIFGPQSAFGELARQSRRQNDFIQNQTQGPGRKPLRISIKADIPLNGSLSSPTSVSREFEARLKRIPALENAGTIKVTMEGRTAVLTGTVKSERDREIAEGLAMLEPGISAVRNQLDVDASAATSEELPAPRR